jgi:hypothetical protein
MIGRGSSGARSAFVVNASSVASVLGVLLVRGAGRVFDPQEPEQPSIGSPHGSGRKVVVNHVMGHLMGIEAEQCSAWPRGPRAEVSGRSQQ